MSQHKDTIAQFLTDLALDGCIIQAGAVNLVDELLTPENYRAYLDAHPNEDRYLLADVPSLVGKRRSKDGDILRKHYMYLDFDLRKFLEEKNEEYSDGMLKEIADGIMHVLNGHPILENWRYCIFTGNGIHIYYIGNSVDIRSLDHWKKGMQQLFMMAEQVTCFPLDTSCCNPAKLSRFPGSRNMKGERAIQTEILAHKNAIFDLSLVETLGMESDNGDASVKKGAGTPVSNSVPEGSRNTMLTSIAGTLRRRGLEGDVLFAALQAINANSCKPPLDEREVKGIAQSIGKYPLSEPRSMMKPPAAPVIVCLKDVEAEEVDWLWGERIPKGNLTMIDGDPGKGKSWLSLGIACAVTRGLPLPGDEARSAQIVPAKVLLLPAEDSLANTIRPRLEGMEADLSRVNILKGVRDANGEEKHLSFSRDLAAVDAALSEGGYALVVVDPLNAYLGDVDTHKDAALRTVLSPLVKLAERHRVAVIGIRHLTKSQRDHAIYRGQGSIGYIGAARAAHLVGVNPNNSEERIILCIKNNLAQVPPPIGFAIRGGEFFWCGVREVDADAILAPSGQSGNGQYALDDAVVFLTEALTEGGRGVAELQEEAEANGISKRTLGRAKQKLGIKARKQKGFGADGGWMWALPAGTKEASSPKDDLWHSLEETASVSDAAKEGQSSFPV